MHNPELILDIGVNYYELAEQDGSSLVAAAAKMIHTASLYDITAVKFQWYKAEKLVTEKAKAYWDTKSDATERQIDLFRKYDKLELKDYEALKKYCDEYGIEFMATAFDSESLEQLNHLVKRHKIASGDITNYEMLKQVSNYGKPVILSTGGAKDAEMSDACDILQDIDDITLLHCMLLYPTEPVNANLWRMRQIDEIFCGRIGYSDHCPFNPVILTIACFFGAEIIEKHFTMTPEAKGNDHYHAVSDKQLYEFCNIFKILNQQAKEDLDGMLALQEESAKQARRGVYMKKDVDQGLIMSFEDVEFLRPQLDGMTPMQFADFAKQHSNYKKKMKKGEQL